MNKLNETLAIGLGLLFAGLGSWNGMAKADAPTPVAPAAALVTPDFGKRGNIFFVGDAVTVKLKGAGATRYEVRGYDGSVVDKGDVADPLTLKVTIQAGTSCTCTKGRVRMMATAARRLLFGARRLTFPMCRRRMLPWEAATTPSCAAWPGSVRHV